MYSVRNSKNYTKRKQNSYKLIQFERDPSQGAPLGILCDCNGHFVHPPLLFWLQIMYFLFDNCTKDRSTHFRIATKVVFGSCKIFSGNAIFGKGKYFQVFGCIMKIVLENIFICLVTFWKCYFSTTTHQNPPLHNRKTTKTPPPTPPQQQQKIRDQRFVGRSKSHKK